MFSKMLIILMLLCAPLAAADRQIIISDSAGVSIVIKDEMCGQLHVDRVVLVYLDKESQCFWVAKRDSTNKVNLYGVFPKNDFAIIRK